MPRRRVPTDTQIEALLTLPTTEADLIRNYTLSPIDLTVIAWRRRLHNRLGFSIQLCALRFPGRLLRPGEVVPQEVLAFVAGQLDVAPDAFLAYVLRSPTRYDQPEVLRATYGFRTFTQPDQWEMAKWLLPVAMARQRQGHSTAVDTRAARTIRAGSGRMQRNSSVPTR